MSIGPVTRKPTASELFNTPTRGSAPQPPRGGINWTYIIIIGGVVIGGIAGAYVYFNTQSRRRQEELIAQASMAHNTQMAALKANAAAHKDSQDRIHSRLDRLEQGITKTTQILESAEPTGKAIIQDLDPIIETVIDLTHQSKSNSINQ
jgi:hypothetical protein